VCDAVDRQRARPANPLAAIVIERNRLLTLLRELLVDDVEHFEKRRLAGNVMRIDVYELPFARAILLAPDFELQIHK
jgi:hypothetical protein